MKSIGKSQLLLSTVHNPEIAQHFGHRHWFHSADKPEQLQTQYHEFARELELADTNTPTQEAQKKLLQWLEQSKKPFLLIFDNAHTFDQLKPFLPTKGGHILLTSRNPQWPHPIEVDPMTQEEAHQLLEKILQHPDEQIDTLATTLGRHPLALAQAGAYIRAHQITVYEYLKRYNGNQKKELLNTNSLLFGKMLPCPIIELINTQYPQAEDLLLACTLITPPEGISQPLLKRLKSTDQENDEPHILIEQGLLKYDVIHDTIFLPQFLKKLILTQYPLEKFTQILSHLAQSLINEYNQDNSAKLIPPLEMLLTHYLPSLGIGQETDCATLHELLGKAYLIENPKKAKKHFKKALAILESQPSPNQNKLHEIKQKLQQIPNQLAIAQELESTKKKLLEREQELTTKRNELQAMQTAKQAKRAAKQATKAAALKEEAARAEKEKIEAARAEQARIEQTRLKLPQCAFGKQKWEEYFGDVGVEPALPPNILEILSSPCPFWPGKKVEETHLLVLIPEKVNGTPLTLKTLGELVQHNLKGTSSKYRDGYFSIGEYTDSPNPSTHWALMTRDVLPESRAKNYETQKNLVAQYAQKAKIPYQVPSVLDATTCIFMEHVHSGIRLYSDKPWTYTRCQEKYNKDWQLVVGGFAPAGLYIYYRL